MNPSESRAQRAVRPFDFPFVFALAIALAVGVLACGGEETPATPKATPESAAPAAGAEAGQALEGLQAEMPVQGEAPSEIKVQMGDDTVVPEDFPSDIPVYPGAKPSASMSGSREGTLIAFGVADGPEKVYDFYQKKLADEGWQIVSSASMGGQWMIHALKGGRATHISIAGEGTGSKFGVAVAKAQ
jgi:hypothetical protein